MHSNGVSGNQAAASTSASEPRAILAMIEYIHKNPCAEDWFGWLKIGNGPVPAGEQARIRCSPIW